jgi:hypothetical protein
MGESYYRELPDDDKVVEVYGKEDPNENFDPYNNPVYNEWQSRNRNSDFFKNMWLERMLVKIEPSFDENLPLIQKCFYNADPTSFVNLVDNSKFHKSIELFLTDISKNRDLYDYENVMLFLIEQEKDETISEERVYLILNKLESLKKISINNNYIQTRLVFKRVLKLIELQINLYAQNNQDSETLEKLVLLYLEEGGDNANAKNIFYVNNLLYGPGQYIDNSKTAKSKLDIINKRSIVYRFWTQFNTPITKKESLYTFKDLKKLAINNFCAENPKIPKSYVKNKIEQLIEIIFKYKIDLIQMGDDFVVRSLLLTNDLEKLGKIAKQQRLILENINSGLYDKQMSLLNSELCLDLSELINYHGEDDLDRYKNKTAFISLFSGEDIPFAIKTFFENGASDVEYGPKLAFKESNDKKDGNIAMLSYDSGIGFESQIGLLLCYAKLGMRFEVSKILLKLVDSFKDKTQYSQTDKKNNFYFNPSKFGYISSIVDQNPSPVFKINSLFLMNKLAKELEGMRITTIDVYNIIVNDILGYKLHSFDRNIDLDSLSDFLD